MDSDLSVEEIREFWTEQARKFGQSPAASWSDTPVISLEIQEILKHLSDGDKVLDIGCANGYSTMQFAAHRSIDATGVDYIPEMIKEANFRLDDWSRSRPLKGKIAFDVGDALNLSFSDNLFDKVVLIRVVINLHDAANQAKAVKEAVRVLKPGGTLLMSEATLQGWKRLNALRTEWGWLAARAMCCTPSSC